MQADSIARSSGFEVGGPTSDDPLRGTTPPSLEATKGEREVVDALARGDVEVAIDGAVRRYGAEVFGWLVAVHGRADATEIYSAFAERLVRALATFRGESSVRTWLYQVARNEARRHRRDALRRRAVFTPIAHHSSVLDRVGKPGSEDARLDERLADLRSRLSPDERELLVLRVDRGFRFREIARIVGGAGDEAGHEREEARLRKRFQTLSTRLRAWALETS